MSTGSNHPHTKKEEKLKKGEEVMPVDDVPLEEKRQELLDEKNKHSTKNESSTENRLKP